jgi:LmbE family N-acetylglucosaminyl deacetylase
VPHTVVFFHAHPDDEALLTSGTMATLSAQGHRVVLVVATAGEAGLAADELTADGHLGDRRRAELEASAAPRFCSSRRCPVIDCWPPPAR